MGLLAAGASIPATLAIPARGGVLHAKTGGGARALGLPTGRIDIGQWADLVVIDLDHPALAGCEVETLAEALVSGANNGVVRGTYVGGSYRSAASVER
jgi:formimidoylglutamate deiminase